MYSTRLEWSARPNIIAERTGERQRAGQPILDLTVSNPTQAGIVYPAEAIAGAFADSRSLHYEPTPAGLASAREAVCGYYADSGIDVDPGGVLLTASTSEAYAYLFKLLADPGDEVLVPRPSYPLFEYLARLESVRVRHYPLFYDHGWHMDLGGLEAAAGDRCRAVIVVNPNNPTGSYLKRGEAEQLALFCQNRGLALISDEVFSDYPLTEDANRVASVAGMEGIATFALSGLSKIVGLPQMKLGWMLINQPAAFERLELIADTYLSVGTPVQLALPRLLELRGDIQRQIRERTRGNLAWLRQVLPAEFGLFDVEGGWYATLRVPRVRTEEEWVLLLLDRGVLVQPGYFYDFESEAHLVLSLLTDPAVFRDGVERLVAAS